MENNRFRYMLRMTIDPTVCADERIDEMVDFCQSAAIDDVMLITCGEHLNTGHITPEEWPVWADLFEKVRRRLSPLGITASLNPWTTTLHGDRGRTLKPGQTFRTMVDPDGTAASAVACPADENFLDYVTDMYRRYAETRPDTLWLEDDMRLHNHAPLRWGGCFCDHHMKLYSEAIGHPVTREELVKAISAEGEPHPYRKAWLDVSRETICNLAERIGRAVFEVDPDIRLGLMCSAPMVHAAEGRDWARMMKALTGNKTPYLRIHLPSYYEESTRFYHHLFTGISRLTAALAPAEIEIAPELENAPWNSFGKSRSFTDFQIRSAALLPSVGITMNIYDMMGNGVTDPARYDSLLREGKPFLNRIAGLDIRVDPTRGVAVSVFEKSAYVQRSTDPSGPQGVCPRDWLFASLLSAFAVSDHFAANRLPQSGIAALSGDSIRSYTDAELDRLFTENRLILDGDAVLALAARGRLDLIGAVSAKVADIPEGERALEEFLVPVCGRDRMRMGVMDDAGDFVEIVYAAATPHKALAALRTPTGDFVMNTITEVGGDLLILPWSRYPAELAQRRCDALMEVLHAFIGDSAAYTDQPYLHLYEYTAGDDRVLALVNFSNDTYTDVRIRTPDAAAFADATLYASTAPDGVPAPIDVISDNCFVLKGRLERLDVVLLKY